MIRQLRNRRAVPETMAGVAPKQPAVPASSQARPVPEAACTTRDRLLRVAGIHDAGLAPRVQERGLTTWQGGVPVTPAVTAGPAGRP